MKAKKRIAIQLFGHLRTFEYTYNSFLQNIIIPNEDDWDIDIFIHTWNELDHSTVNYRNVEGKPLTDKQLTKDDIKKAKKLYNPKDMLIEPQLKCDEIILTEKMGGFKRSIKGCLNMSYTIYKSSELRKNYAKKHKIDYDWVIVTRPDLLFKKIFSINEIFSSHKTLGFEIPSDAIFYGFNPFGRENMIEEPQFLTGSDLIFMGKPENIDKATNLYEDFDNNIDKNNFYCMEVWWGNYWRKQNLKPYAINYKDGPDFAVLKTLIFNKKEEDDKQDKNNTKPESENDIKPSQNNNIISNYHTKKSKQIKRKIEKAILSLFPYFLVKRRINYLKTRLKNR